MEHSRPKIVVKVKKQHLYDEYVLTNKHIICKFKYLVTCFDHQEDGQQHGLVCLKTDRLKELIMEQNIAFDSLRDDGYLSSTLKKLRDWHPSINKVEVDVDAMYELEGLLDYSASWEAYQPCLTSLVYNNCVSSEDDFKLFEQSRHNVVNVNVYFKLVRKIEKITDYGVNFKYLHKLLTQSLINMTNEKPLFLDEVSIESDRLPFALKMDTDHDEDEDEDEDEDGTCYVYPYMCLIPLYPPDI
jgi:hypothetical protein